MVFIFLYITTVQISNIRKSKYAGSALGSISKSGEELGQVLIDAGLARGLVNHNVCYF